ncbi:glycosyltransferase family 2 protein [Neobacillus niacini]|uniref:glycosyltransferase family 2 protein n=1 Tax=Neobacillus niacini TaxID=86668 RepID=UPI0007AB5030|nr:glycosyltransferase family 2 protein [Neobacillus niacini]MEC1526144.1 glycosyltransferase family 2 protein [Neobacillus niacini]
MEKYTKPIVSVITPTYNAARYITETIHSVKDQTFTNWEMIIVDDASLDNTVEIVKEEMVKDSRIKLIELEKNSGPAYARNIAISAANGDYLAFLDSDDLWLPKKLERQLMFMEQNNLAFSYTAYRIMTENGERTDVVFQVPVMIDYKSLLKNTIIGTLTVMLDRRKVGIVQMPLHRDCSEDYGLWLSILSKGIKAVGLTEELAIYRKCEKSLSSNKLKSAQKTWNTYRKVENFTIPSSLWYFANYSIRALKKHSKTKAIKDKSKRRFFGIEG